MEQSHVTALLLQGNTCNQSSLLSGAVNLGTIWVQGGSVLNGKESAASLVVLFVTWGVVSKLIRRPRILDGCHLADFS